MRLAIRTGCASDSFYTTRGVSNLEGLYIAVDKLGHVSLPPGFSQVFTRHTGNRKNRCCLFAVIQHLQLLGNCKSLSE